MPAATHERAARAVQDSDGQFGSLTLGRARLSHDLLTDQDCLPHRFQAHGQRPVKQVPILDGGVQHVAQSALMAEQQADGTEIR
ncbi:hypothetical protein D3C85_1038620 [compost metagenome]